MSSQAQACASAILAAAGVGARCVDTDQKLPKQFYELHGRPLFVWPLSALISHMRVERVVIVTLSDMVPVVKREAELLKPDKDVQVIAGGASRQASVFKGLEFLETLSPCPKMVLVHDAARPFLTGAMIEQTIVGAQLHGACTTALPARDTVKRIEDGMIIETLDRESLILVQTPQAARFDWLIAAHRKAADHGVAATDDAALLEAAGRRVAIVRGASFNIKITEPEDLILSEALANRLFEPRG